MSSAYRRAVNRNTIEANKMPSSEGKIRLSGFLNTTKRPGTWNLQSVALHANTIYIYINITKTPTKKYIALHLDQHIISKINLNIRTYVKRYSLIRMQPWV